MKKDKKRRFFKWLACILAVILGVELVFVTVNYFYIGRYEKYILNSNKNHVFWQTDSKVVGIVFGGGIENGKPRPLLKDRLDVAAELLKDKQVRKLLVSGDNRFLNYNEPQVMKDYLVNEKGVSPGLIQLDNAGRSTYETCERAKAIFGLNKAILISQSTHLPRAIFTCRSFGIEAYGYNSDISDLDSVMMGQRLREILARTKATLNIYLIGEDTVLGDKIKI